uniref:Uncharacterized protein n=1 Tax=Romanomermis culicivorax TaxID=13658 RepID=A0A915J6X9_ROMCU
MNNEPNSFFVEQVPMPNFKIELADSRAHDPSVWAKPRAKIEELQINEQADYWLLKYVDKIMKKLFYEILYLISIIEIEDLQCDFENQILIFNSISETFNNLDRRFVGGRNHLDQTKKNSCWELLPKPERIFTQLIVAGRTV